jgi:F0F1-type ATP synthase membrane subunit b/b'
VTELLGVNVAEGGAAAIVTFVVLLILLGRLVPRSVLEDVRKDRDARVAEAIADRDARIAEAHAERDTWRDAHKESEAARIEAQSQVGELIELSRTSAHVLRALRGEVPGNAMEEVAAPPS